MHEGLSLPKIGKSLTPKDPVKQATDAVTNEMENIFRKLTDPLKSAVDVIPETVKSTIDQSSKAITSRMDQVVDPIMDQMQRFPKMIGDTETRLTGAVKKMVDESGNVLQSSIRPIPTLVQNAERNITKGVNRVADETNAAIDRAVAPLQKQLDEIPKLMKQSERKITKGINESTKEATRAFKVALRKFDGFVQFIVDVFASLESFLLCGLQKVVFLPQCWYYYALEMVGKLYYLPISFIVWLFSLQQIETLVWDALEEADSFVFELTSGRKTEEVANWVRSMFGDYVTTLILPLVGSDQYADDPYCPVDPFAVGAEYGPANTETGASSITGDLGGIHLIHFPKSVVDKCYSCKVRKFPKPGKYF